MNAARRGRNRKGTQPLGCRTPQTCRGWRMAEALRIPTRLQPKGCVPSLPEIYLQLANNFDYCSAEPRLRVNVLRSVDLSQFNVSRALAVSGADKP